MLTCSQNFDTDVVIAVHDSSSRFFLSGPGRQPEERETALMTLQQSWSGYRSRQDKVDREWIAELRVYLDHLVDMRLRHVQEWMSSNQSRFKTNHASFETLRRAFEASVVDLKAHVQICQMQCGSCHLHCLLSRLHEGLHDCQTSHQCPHTCEYSSQHQGQQIPCGFRCFHLVSLSMGAELCVSE
jgi:hypothetical protein